MGAARATTGMDESGDMSDSAKQNASSRTNAADDVATLYSWANLHGAKYRDFTASRLELRAQARRRAGDAAAHQQAPSVAAASTPIIDENMGVSVRQEAAQTAEQAAQRSDEMPSAAKQDDGGPIMPAWLKHMIPRVQDREGAAEAPQVQASESAAQDPWTEQSPAPTPDPGFRRPAEPRGLGERHLYQPGPEERLGAASSNLQPQPQLQWQPAPVQPETRWSALQSLFDTARRHEPIVSSVQRLHAPVLALFSVAGGVGKSSLAANLSRALAGYGERTLLTETSVHGVLPYYFGARGARPGVLRTFASSLPDQAPVQLLSLDGDRYIAEGSRSQWLYEELQQASREANRIVIDVTGGLLGSIRQVLRLNPAVVVPVLPDVSSAAALQAVEDFFRMQQEAIGLPIQRWFLLNQFDSSLPLHRDVRDMLLQNYGERLLPFVVHRSPAVSEALAEGLTVLDYAPASEVANDILHFAGWVRSLVTPGVPASRGVRWSER